MKKLLLATVLFTIFIITGCKKEGCPTPEVPVNLCGATFKGAAVVGSINYSTFNLTFNADGSAAVTIGTYAPFPGSWNKTPNSSVVYFFFYESSTLKWKREATLNAANNKLEAGVVTRTVPSAINGTFTADKQ